MLRFIKNNIREQEVGCVEWVQSVTKLALMTLTPDQREELDREGCINVIKNVGVCNNRRTYVCVVTLTKVGTSYNTHVKYDELMHRAR
jgi:hypothetical protein